ncbi:MAG TPA: hypothetical protein VII31_00665 [Caldimonas sp.]
MSSRLPVEATATIDPRWHEVMTGLLYPAVLGAILFTFFDRLTSRDLALPEPTLVAALALLVLFTFDYAHTMSCSVSENYGPGEFACDTVILCLLFLAGKQLVGAAAPHAPSWLSTPLWELMALTKAASVVWEVVRTAKRTSIRASLKLSANVKADVAFALAYLALGMIFQVASPAFAWLMAVVLARRPFLRLAHRRMTGPVAMKLDPDPRP